MSIDHSSYFVLANGGPLQATLSDLPATSAGVGANTPRLPFAHLATSESMDRVEIPQKDGKMVDFKGENQLQMVDFLPS